MHSWDPLSEMSSALMPADAPSTDLEELDTAALVPVAPEQEEPSTGSRGLAALWEEEVEDEDTDLLPECVLDAATMDPVAEGEDDEEPWLIPDEPEPAEAALPELPGSALTPIH